VHHGLTHLTQVSRVNPTISQSNNTIAQRIRSLIDASKWTEAWTELRPLLDNEPSNPTYRWVAGLLQHELKHPDEALEHLRFAAKHIKDEPELFQKLGELEHVAGHLEASKQAYDQSIAMLTGVSKILANAALEESQGNVSLAIALLEQAYALDPKNHDVVFKLAHLHQITFDPSEALTWAMRAVKLKEDHIDSYLLLGTVLQRMKLRKEAVELYESLLLMRPDFPVVNQNLGMLCVNLGLNREAIRFFSRAVQSDPTRLDLESRIIQQFLFLNDWSEIHTRASSLLERLRTTKLEVSPFGMLSVPGITANDMKIAAERNAEKIRKATEPFVGRFRRQILPDEGDRKLKIGYLSCDFYEHATAYLMARLFELHDHSQFEIYAYSWDKATDSPLRQRVIKAFDVSRDIRQMTDFQAAEIIHSDQIDILVDLKGYTFDGRLSISAFRPAPLVVHHVGFPGSLGATFVDYLVADKIVAPIEHPEFFSEKIAYLPDCYQPTDENREIGERPTRAACGLPEDGIVFCCFNQSYKFTPDVFDIWCRLLRDVDKSVFWMLIMSNGSADNLRLEAKRRDVDPNRLIVGVPLPQTPHLGRLQNADIVLDTLPVNAHTTASDALWAGVPIVTLPGEPFVSRVASSIVTSIGLPELVAKDAEDYYQIAKKLATDREYLETTRQKVREGRKTSPLFDSKRYTKNLEMLYRVMWKRVVSGQAPAAIDIHGEVK
jgi:predicted O-linked N-acetylglucosamine transferase (SPINDLY family)